MSKMSLAVVSTLGLLVIIHAVGGMQLEPKQPSKRCECYADTNQPINKKFFKKIDIYLPRSYCEKMEILVTLKNGKIVCIDPYAQWFAGVLNIIEEKKKANQKKTAKLLDIPE
ncbi:C-X-C motif chemokine 13 [Mixophyes fleayi]|uniref:C-X-C motif chemokine 13 n=1 Tax=Mixophyes fleayi TaxID=3061075 RepID=UPI003F4E44A5